MTLPEQKPCCEKCMITKGMWDTKVCYKHNCRCHGKRKEMKQGLLCWDNVTGEQVRLTGITFGFAGEIETVGICFADSTHQMRLQGEDLKIYVV